MKKILLFAAAAAIALSSCMKDAGVNNTPVDVETRGGARMNVSISLPRDMGTRADHAASAVESTVETITVFMFDAAGTALSVPTNGMAQFAFADFQETTPGSGVYGLKTDTDRRIKTVAGSHKMYIGINLPASVAGPFANEAALFQANESITNLTTADKFVMFSDMKPVTLVEYDEDDEAGTVGKLSADIKRVAAKFVTSTSLTGMQDVVEWEGVKNTSGVKIANLITYTITEYNVYNETTQSYIAEGPATWAVRNSYDNSYIKGNKAVVLSTAYPAGSTALRDLVGYYIGENDPTNDGVDASLKGNTTYAYVSTRVAMAATTIWDETAPAGQELKWTGAPTTLGTTLYVIPNGLETYITATTAERDQICTGMKGASVDPLAYYTYTEGYVHFPVFLNPGAEINSYVIERNMFINLLVNNIKAVEGKFTGNPGDPTEPKKPIDPTDPTNPDPWDPTDEVDGESAVLDVEFKVLPWNYVEQGVELQR